ncbi:MAG: hypothetical protein WEG36_12170 [Gemmatimonadota bacterium]
MFDVLNALALDTTVKAVYDATLKLFERNRFPVYEIGARGDLEEQIRVLEETQREATRLSAAIRSAAEVESLLQMQLAEAQLVQVRAMEAQLVAARLLGEIESVQKRAIKDLTDAEAGRYISYLVDRLEERVQDELQIDRSKGEDLILALRRDFEGEAPIIVE